MAVTYSTAVKTARMTAVRDQIDAGGDQPGRAAVTSRLSEADHVR